MRTTRLRAVTALSAAGLTVTALLSGCALAEVGDQVEEEIAEIGANPNLDEFLAEHRDVLAQEAVLTVIDDGEVTFASTEGADIDTPFELASLSKPMTGMLLVDAVERGEVDLDDELSEHLPQLEGAPAGGATLQELVTHTSGLPLVPEAEGFAGQVHQARTVGENPYELSLEEFLELSAQQELHSPGTYEYSNMGIALLGHALAAQAGTTYPELLQERLAGPLGMESTSTDEEGLIPGYDDTGEVESYASEAFAPSSSIRSSVGDYIDLVAAIFDGDAPGAASIEQSEIEPTMALGWQYESDGEVWHNGISNGYATVVWMDPATETAAIIFSNYGRENTTLGEDLFDLVSD